MLNWRWNRESVVFKLTWRSSLVWSKDLEVFEIGSLINIENDWIFVSFKISALCIEGFYDEGASGVSGSWIVETVTENLKILAGLDIRISLVDHLKGHGKITTIGISVDIFASWVLIVPAEDFSLSLECLVFGGGRGYLRREFYFDDTANWDGLWRYYF